MMLRPVKFSLDDDTQQTFTSNKMLLLQSHNTFPILQKDPASASSGGNEAFIFYAKSSSLTSDIQTVFTYGLSQPVLSFCVLLNFLFGIFHLPILR